MGLPRVHVTFDPPGKVHDELLAMPWETTVATTPAGREQLLGDVRGCDAIVHLARALKMDTTAEGVEDEDQLDCLRLHGCGSIQGHLFSRPVEADKVAALISDESRRAA